MKPFHTFIHFKHWAPYNPDLSHPLIGTSNTQDMASRLTLTCVTVMINDFPTFFIVTLAASILTLAAHTQIRPQR